MKNIFLQTCFTLLQVFIAVNPTDLHDFVELLENEKNEFQHINETIMIVIADENNSQEEYEQTVPQPNDLYNEISHRTEEEEDEPNIFAILNETDKLVLRNGIRKPRPRKKMKKAGEISKPESEGPAGWHPDRLRAHERRIAEVTDFMMNHQITTIYLYNEVLRIAKTHEILDELRAMVHELENPNYRKLKEVVMKCYYMNRKPVEKTIWAQGHNTNNLVIHAKKDPINDGVNN